MSLERKAIKLAFVSLLKNAKTSADKNVTAYRINKNWVENLPAINIYPSSETGGEIFHQSPLEFKKTLLMEIDCLVKGKDEDDAGEKLDTLIDQIEEAIGEKFVLDRKFRDLVSQYYPSSLEINFKEDGKFIVGGATLNLTIVYISPAPRSEANLVDLKRFGVDISVGPNSENIESLTEFPIS